MRTPSVHDRRRGDIAIAMTPMIDVVFLLLVFFLWTASFRIVEYVLPSQVTALAGTSDEARSDDPPPELDFDEIVIRILWTGDGPAWSVNDAPVASLGEVRDYLSRIASVKTDAPVILDPDPQVPLGDVIDVYDAARLERFEKVHFAASEGV
ncbi:MAG: biopolymer transporter ExbD [Planctomycetes bacterium]|nr:biopolymer transporter ExbD [Planctomycetota bacterium]